tara:strand:+ start:3032 stop:3301 length:270 start_codon:yes stop_codon:yes gene_type:complete
LFSYFQSPALALSQAPAWDATQGTLAPCKLSSTNGLVSLCLSVRYLEQEPVCRQRQAPVYSPKQGLGKEVKANIIVHIKKTGSFPFYKN